MLVLDIFCMSYVRGKVSEALLMSIAVRSVLCAGLGIFRDLRVCIVLALLGVLWLRVGL